MRTSISPSSSLGLLHTDPRQVCRESSPLASLMKSDAPLQLGYGNVFGLSTDANWVGNQYSLVSTMNAIAQLAWQPFSSYLIIRVPARTLMHPLSSAGVRPRPVWQLPLREYKRRHFGRLLLTLAVLASMRSLLPDSSSVFSKLDACPSSIFSSRDGIVDPSNRSVSPLGTPPTVSPRFLRRSLLSVCE